MTGAPRTERPWPLPEPLPHPVVDQHCHLDMSRGDAPPPDVAEVLADAASVGVDRVVHIGCDVGRAHRAVELAREHRAVVAAVGLHPNEAPLLAERGELDDAIAQIATLAKQDRVRAIGETGLDYYRTPEAGRAAQEDSLRAHVHLAREVGKPLQIHDREAHEDVLRILADEAPACATVLHCFSGDASMARECVARGYYLSFAGPVTFKNAASLREALAVVPLDRLLVETDAPFLAPAPHRGATNAPALVPYTARAMAQFLDLDLAELCAALSANAERLYGPW